MKRKSFKRKWSQIKKTMDEVDLDFFHETIHQGYIDRVLTANGYEYNPRYMGYWFPTCRCHSNVIFPTLMLNRYNSDGRYKIITNEKHSAIYDPITDTIYDPTYDANGSPEEATLNMFKDGFKILTIDEFLKESWD